MHWGRQRPGDPGHAARIGAGNGALGQTTARGSGARRAYWGRQRCIGAGKLPTPMPVFLPQCGSPDSGAHCGRGLEPRSAPKKAPSAPRSGQRGSSAAPTDCVQHTPRFHSDTAIRVGDSAGCPAPAQRTRETLGFRGKVFANRPQQARLPFENTTSLAKQPKPRPSTILLCVTKVRRVPQPALHAPVQTRARIGAGNSALEQETDHWGRQTRALIGAGNSALEQETDHWGRLITCPNAD